jgi:diguanylate cyclase (GGDEF)-like protein/PAS domain S-box-containing protein
MSTSSYVLKYQHVILQLFGRGVNGDLSRSSRRRALRSGGHVFHELSYRPFVGFHPTDRQPWRPSFTHSDARVPLSDEGKMSDSVIRVQGGDDSELELLRRILNTLPAMVAYWDADQRCRFANQDYERWFGVKPEWVLGRRLEELLGPIYPLNLPYIEGALRGEPQLFEREIPDPKGGPPRHSQAHYVPDVVDGVVRGFSVLVADITARKRMEDALRRATARLDILAKHDALTGLANRTVAADRLERAISLNRRCGMRCAVLYVDLDGFKQVNDTYGHATGDAALRLVAVRLQQAVRQSDTVARLGGDEFIVLLPRLDDGAGAEKAARHILAVMTQDPFMLGGTRVDLTCSIGVAIFPEHGTTADRLAASADDAMYRAKRSGGNQYAVAYTSAPSIA